MVCPGLSLSTHLWSSRLFALSRVSKDLTAAVSSRRHEWRVKRDEVMQQRQQERKQRLAAAQRDGLKQLGRWQATSAGYGWASASPEY